MPTCSFCGIDVWPIYQCYHCGRWFCVQHYPPVNHYCININNHHNYHTPQYKQSHSSKKRQKYKLKKYTMKLTNIIKTAIYYSLTICIILIILSFWASDSAPLTNTDITPTTPINHTYKAPLTNTDITPTTPINHTYKYVLNGSNGLIFFITYENIFQIYSTMNNGYYYNSFEEEVIFPLLRDTTQDKYLQSLVSNIQQKTPHPNQQARIAISMVQHIPYNHAGDGYAWQYPYETLHKETGVCSDKSILLVYLLNEIGYDVVLFNFPTHMAVGIKSAPEYDFYDSGYAFIETTQPSIITYEPPVYIDGSVLTTPTVIHISEDGMQLEVSSDYYDAQQYSSLLGMENVLDEYQYSIWQELVEKYDLFYT